MLPDEVSSARQPSTQLLANDGPLVGQKVGVCQSVQLGLDLLDPVLVFNIL